MNEPKQKKRPGVMIYFETKNCIKRLDLEDKGRLLDAILEYGENHTPPDFSEDDDVALCIAWDVICPRIDNDASRYFETCISAQYSNYCKSAKSEGKEPLSRSEWETKYSIRNRS